MAFEYPAIRKFLYFALWLFSFVLFGLTATRLHYTLHLPPGDPLNHGKSFYDPIVAELLFSSVVVIFWAPFIVNIIYARRERKYFSKVWHELIGLLVIWVLWLIGAAIATSIWPNLPSFCAQFEACRLLTAMVAFAWIGWITVTALLIVTLMFTAANRSWFEPAHGYWVREDPRRTSIFSQQYPTRRV